MNSPLQGEGSLVGVDAVGGDFDFGNAAEREQELYEVLGWLLGSLFHDVANRVGDRGLEHDALGLQAGKVHAHELAGLEHESYTRIVALRVVKCKAFASEQSCTARIHRKLRSACDGEEFGCATGTSC